MNYEGGFDTLSTRAAELSMSLRLAAAVVGLYEQSGGGGGQHQGARYE